MNILRCPFCGKEAKVSKSWQWMLYGKYRHKRLTRVWKVFCKFCYGQTTYCKTEEEAIKRWNERVYQPPNESWDI